MTKNTINVVIVGVGGQGIILTSNILAEVAFRENYDVKKSEVHGMAQRGGSVMSEIRFGEKVCAPLIKRGEANFVVALEKLEALRFVDYLDKEGVLIVNDLKIPPLGVSLGKEDYPPDIFDCLAQKTSHLIKVNAIEMAKKAGNIKTMNVVLLGVLAYFLPFALVSWKGVMQDKVPFASLDFNLKAFDLGIGFVKSIATREDVSKT